SAVKIFVSFVFFRGKSLFWLRLCCFAFFRGNFPAHPTRIGV
ncbi:MAG: hypothetical protein QOJ40_404, partial [Verrucomicrobiota bacterium]